MSISMDDTLAHMKLAVLAERGSDELTQHSHREATHGRYCLEIFRRAIIEQTDQAWSVLQEHLSDIIRKWLRCNPYKDIALRHDSEENYIAQTFSRFWCAVHDQQVEFSSLSAALSYLHATLNGLLLDTLRTHLRSQNIQVSLPEPDSCEELITLDSYDGYLLWETLKKLLPDKREQRLTYLLYYCGLKPREIVARCPSEFHDVKEIYRLNHNILERLRRNRVRLRWLLGENE